MAKMCEICGKPLPVRKLLGMSLPIMEGEHEPCLREFNRRKAEAEALQALRERAEKAEKIIEAGFDGASIDWRSRTLDRFQAEGALAELLELAKTWGVGGHKGVVLSGAPGVGKTHMLVGLAVARARETCRPFRFLRFGTWVDCLRSASFEESNELVKVATYAETLYLDDLGSDPITEFVDGRLCRVLDHRVEFKLPTFATTNLSGKDLEGTLSKRVLSRLSALCDFQPMPRGLVDWRQKK